MIQLLLETATDICSVAVAKDGEPLAERTAAEVHRHAGHLTLFIAEVMAKAGLKMTGLNEVVLSDGPGSYTSLRVGAATAKGLCVALPGLKLRVVSTLEALAMASGEKNRPVLATINSRKGEVFGQLFLGAGTRVKGEVFKKQGIPPSLHPLLLGPRNIRLTEAGWLEEIIAAAGTNDLIVCGAGAERLSAHLPEGVTLSTSAPHRCSAVHLSAPASVPETSRLVDFAAYEPFYLNPPFVTKSKKKLLG